MIKVLKIWISKGHDFKGRHGKGRMNFETESRDMVELVANRGIKGDRYFDHKPDFKGQITFFSEEVARQLEQELELPAVDRSAFRRNALVSGTDLNELVGRKFTIGGVEFSGSEECALVTGWTRRSALVPMNGSRVGAVCVAEYSQAEN